MKHSALLWILTVVVLVLVLGWGSGSLLRHSQPVTSQGDALIGGHFELVNAAGKTVTEKDFAGKYMLVFFGFTHCPDVCPTVLLTAQNTLNDLGANADKIVPIFITIDPERDTPKIIGEYASHFGPRVIGLSGSAAQIKQAADAYKVYYAKIENSDDPKSYMMDHSTFIYLMGPDGKYITHFPDNVTEAQLKDTLLKALH